MIALDKQHWLCPTEERERYEHHNNSPEDPHYRDFLGCAVNPLLPFLSHDMIGLDYGCGPGPTVSVMLKELGFKVEDYDPIFSPIVLHPPYDFITCTETIEHFRFPQQEFVKISKLIRPSGSMVFMTEVFDDKKDFEQWWYIRDTTHVSFYRAETFEWIRDHFKWEMIVPSENVRIFQANFR